MPRQLEATGVITVQDALNLLTVNDLKQLVALLSTATKPTRKGELIDLIEQNLQGEGLRELWDQLDRLQQLAVAETLHSFDDWFNEARFKAKYGALPGFSVKKNHRGYGGTPTLLRLFIYSGTRWNSTDTGTVPDDLKQRLQHFVLQPETATLKSSEALPERLELCKEEFELQENEDGMIQRDTERDALVDLPMLLRLIDTGKVAVSNKTFQPSSATMKVLADLLNNGDFYELKPKTGKWQQDIGPIKAFAWPLLIQASKLVELHGNKLSLTKAGRNALAKSAAEILRLIWQRWTKTKLLDEFNRINEIKGQRGQAKR